MKKQINRKIYLLSKKPMKPIEVVQYETGVQLVFEVQDIDLDTTATATMFVRKPSGKFVFQEDNITLTGNTVVVDLHNQAITEYGHPFFQIKFKKDEEVISTYSGMLTVEKSLDDSGAEESKTVLAAFEELTDEQIARIEEATRSQIDLMKAEVEAKGETVLATIPDEYTEMYNRVNTLFNSVANAIKGAVSGSVVRVDDVSPVEHKPFVKVVCPEGVDPTTVTVRRYGKNLFPVTVGTYNGVTLSKYNDYYVLNGTATGAGLFITKIGRLSAGTYTLSANNPAHNSLGNIFVPIVQVYSPDTLESIAVIDDRINGVATATIKGGENYESRIRYQEGITYNNFIIKPQFEFNNTATEYSAHKEATEYTPSSDGTVEGITSLSPTMTLLTDTDGITIECEYNKDTGKVIKKLTDAVVALGGVV